MPIIEDLIVSDYGAFIGLRGKRLRITAKDNDTFEVPLLHLKTIQITTRSASVSASALAACCEAGIPVHFVDVIDGNYATVLSSKLNTVIATRRHQLTAIDNGIGVDIAHQIALGKITSQANTLRYLARRRDDDLGDELRNRALDILAYTEKLTVAEADNVAEIRAHFMGIEGYVARLYWEGLSWLIPAEYEFSKRTGRHATDPVNVLLNYGYGILYGEVQNALVIAGLDPYAGIVHTDRPGKPSLTLDLIEEFRAPIVDRPLVGLLNRHYEVHFDADGRLERDFRKGYAEHIISRLSAQGIVNEKRYSLRSIIQIQARRLASAFRGEQAYVAYAGGR